MAARRGSNATTEGMKGSGYYDAHSEYQRRVIEGGDKLIHEAVDGLDLAEPAGPLTVADYGAGTGATSAHAVGTALAALRQRDDKWALQAIHNDVPGNDFTQLFTNIAGEDGYLSRIGGPLYALAAAGSFFEQVVPYASVDLGMCSNASHWLREQPVASIPDGMYFCEASGAAREQIARQAADDWFSFLTARAVELRGGGRLLVQGIASNDDGDRVSAAKLLRVMWQAAAWVAEDGLLNPDALAGYVFPVYCRSPSEALAPLGPGTPLEDVFKVVRWELDEVSNPYWEAYERDGDAEAYARIYTEFVRAFAESTMLTHLFEPAAKGIEPKALSDEYFDRLRKLNASDPESGRYEAWILRLMVERG